MLDRAQAGDVAEPDARRCSPSISRSARCCSARPNTARSLLLVLTPAEIASAIEISDADLKKGYEERKARYATPERRHLQQIVFPNIEEAKAAADKLAKGTTFEALAAERGLKDTDIDLGTVTKSAMVDRAVADAAFALKEGEVSAPVEGRFGIVLVQADKIEPASTQAVRGGRRRAQAGNGRGARQGGAAHRSRQDRGRAARRRDAGRHRQEAQPQTRTIEAIDRAGQDRDGKPVADLPQGVDLVSAAFRADHGLRERSAAAAAARRLRLVRRRWTSRRRATARSTRSRTSSLTRWRDDQIASRLKAKANEMLDKLKAGTPFADVAAADKLNAEWRPGLKRGSPPPGFPARALDEIFRNPEGRRPPAPKAPRRRTAWCSASPRSRCRRSMPSRPTPSASTMLLRRAIVRRHARPICRAAGNRHRRHHQSGRAQPDHRRQPARTEARPHADRAAGRAPSRNATPAARRRWCGPRWSPTSRRRSRRS